MKAPKRLRWPFRSLAVRLLAVILLVVLAVLGLGLWTSHRSLQEQGIRSVRQELHAGLAAANQSLRNRLDLLALLTQTIAFDNTVLTTLRLGALPQLESRIKELAERYNLNLLLVTDHQGRVVTSFSGGLEPGENLADHPVVRAALQRNAGAACWWEEHSAIRRSLQEQGKRDSQVSPLLLGGAWPLVSRERLLGGVVVGVLFSGNTPLIEAMRESAGAEALAVVHKSRVLVASGVAGGVGLTTGAEFPGEPLTDQERLGRIEDGRGRIASVYAGRALALPGIEAAELSLVAQRDHEVIREVLRQVRWQYFWLLPLCLIVALGLAWLFARSITGPVERLAKAMRQLPMGKVSQALPVERDDEIGELVSGFNTMAGILDDRIDELDNEVRQRRRTEQQLAEEKELLAVTLSAIEEAVVVGRPDGSIALINHAACTLAGCTEDEGRDRLLPELFPFLPAIDEVAAEHGPVPASSLQVTLGRRQLDLVVSRAPLHGRLQSLLGEVLVMRDVTARRRMEEEQIRRQKLESVGALAGGIAHDFNNLLTGILGNINLADDPDLAPDERHELLAEAEKGASRATALTRQLLTFARGGAPVRKLLDLSGLIEESANLMRRGSPVVCRFQLPADLWPVSADRGQIGQVVENLVLNAIQAMPEGGELLINARNRIVAADEVPGLPAGRYVLTQVKDLGVGIAADDLERIFDPYFTTKAQGNGLGLATCYAIVRKHEGALTVRSSIGQGSTFCIFLPAAPEGGSVEVAGEEAAPGSVAGIRVLVLDDEEMVRRVAASMLQRLGCGVDGVATGEEALTLYRERLEAGAPYDLVIMDLTIPGAMGGQEAISRLRAMDPGARAIVSSGYATHPVMAEYRQHGFCAVMGKPYRLEEMRRALAECRRPVSEV
ncbi:MAG: hypothetical protein BWK76_17670 [Desulfobulbaceae bacterium A2]|nr:MAG: hypothetical protein BWK76_17670 [Desulfobulbaceae bacterium A2]